MHHFAYYYMIKGPNSIFFKNNSTLKKHTAFSHTHTDTYAHTHVQTFTYVPLLICC